MLEFAWTQGAKALRGGNDMGNVSLRLALSSMAALSAMDAPCRAEAEKLVFFAPVLVNSSPMPTTPEEKDRLAAFDAQIRADLVRSGQFALVDAAPLAPELEKIDNIADCNGCELDLARKLGARYAAVAWVQKISNLILNMNLRIVDVRDGSVSRAGSVDIRGNDDRSWTRGETYLLRERIFGPAR